MAWSSCNVETLLVKLPEATKGQRKFIPRDSFTKCGESTNFSKTFTGVPARTLAGIPRLTTDGKTMICGPLAVGNFERQRVQNEVERGGRPLFLGGWKPVSLFTTWIRDFGVTDFFDTTAASGVGAIAGIYIYICIYIYMQEFRTPASVAMRLTVNG